MIIVEVDGACSGNPGVGGWAIRILRDSVVIYSSYGYQKDTTNNRMEVTAFIHALKTTMMLQKIKEEVLIKTDSQWAYNCITGCWNCTKNVDLLKRADRLMGEINVSIERVGRDELKYVDILAKRAVEIGKKKYERQNQVSP